MEAAAVLDVHVCMVHNAMAEIKTKAVAVSFVVVQISLAVSKIPI